MNWNSASRYCTNQHRNSHLVVITSAAEQTAVQWLNCPATGGGSLSLKLQDYTFVRVGKSFEQVYSIPSHRALEMSVFVHS